MSSKMNGLNKSAMALNGAIERWDNKPSRWCKGHFAEDAHGGAIYSTNERAVAWCAMGAVEVSVARELLDDNWVDNHIDAMLGFRWADNGTALWNDSPGRTFEEVRDRFTAYFGLCAVQGG